MASMMKINEVTALFGHISLWKRCKLSQINSYSLLSKIESVTRSSSDRRITGCHNSLSIIVSRFLGSPDGRCVANGVGRRNEVTRLFEPICLWKRCKLAQIDPALSQIDSCKPWSHIFHEENHWLPHSHEQSWSLASLYEMKSPVCLQPLACESVVSWFNQLCVLTYWECCTISRVFAMGETFVITLSLLHDSPFHSAKESYGRCWFT